MLIKNKRSRANQCINKCDFLLYELIITSFLMLLHDLHLIKYEYIVSFPSLLIAKQLNYFRSAHF